MADQPIKCPLCSQTGEACDHDQAERVLMCQSMGVQPEPEPEVYDASNVEQINAKRSKVRRKEMAGDADLIALMKRPDGRRFVWSMLERCGIFRTSFRPSQPDPYLTAFHEGERNVGLQLMSDIHRLCMADYVLMLKERGDAAA